MIIGYRREGAGLAEAPAIEDAGWIDLFRPDEAERARVSELIGATLPSREDQEEIERSSRLYIEDGAAFMTAIVPAQALSDAPVLAPVTFILTQDRLVTLRRHDPQPFRTFPKFAARAPLGCDSPGTILIGLVDEIIGRLADITENVGREIEGMSLAAFRSDANAGRDMRKTLRGIGRKDDTVMQVRESLLTLERILGFLGPVMDQRKAPADVRLMLRSQIRDIRAISEQAGFLMQKTALLLDATLGLINIEQSAIIKVFSVAAVVFLPPTLIASIYGMNFAVMPELSWPYAYPAALVAMVASAVGPLYFFKRKGWL
ncbi:magnesium transporter CorA family protein [Pikeienuella sp. HZG-20]|uniref:magnesium transporter CorA family protein n=1 Tax=Paludibacillus litoralis TaxID=3133267 RepID=UPI0030EE302C